MSHVKLDLWVAGEREAVEEARVEVVVPPSRLEAVVAALRETHPYQEAAFDVYPRLSAPVPAFGMGRIGLLPSPMTQVGCPQSTGWIRCGGMIYTMTLFTRTSGCRTVGKLLHWIESHIH